MVILGIFISAFVAMNIGRFWYSPMLFGKAWERLSGCSPAKVDAKVFVMAFLNQVIVATAVFYLIRLTSAHTWEKILPLDFLVWLGFIATTLLNGVIWEREPFKLYLIYSFYHLAVICSASIIFILLRLT